MGTPLFGCSATAAAATIWPIVKFDADYVLLEKIGQGKFGEVFKIEDCRSRMVHAAKMMRCSRASEKLRVRDEIEILSGLEHPNVLKLVGAYEDSENFIQGANFRSIISMTIKTHGYFFSARISLRRPTVRVHCEAGHVQRGQLFRGADIVRRQANLQRSRVHRGKKHYSPGSQTREHCLRPT